MSEFINIFAFDPGDKNNGFCHFKYFPEKKKADLRIKKIMSPEELDDFLLVIYNLAKDPSIECVFVVENFRMDSKVRGAAFQFSEMLTSQRIGCIRMIAAWTKSKFVTQEPGNVLSTGKKWSQFKVNKAHVQDDVSAYMHGVYYMLQKRWIMTPDDVLLFGQEHIL